MFDVLSSDDEYDGGKADFESENTSNARRAALQNDRGMIIARIKSLEGQLRNLRRKVAEIDNEILTLPVEHSQNWGSYNPEWHHRLLSVMKSTFKLKPEWRPHQLEAMNATMSGKNVMLVMPTGGGKSLCFQLPAAVESLTGSGFTVVISPLVSLSEDQVYSLRERGVRASVLAAYTDKEEVKTIYNEMVNPQGSLQLLYVSPEKIAESKRFMQKLQR